jgi:hypothetical protein
MRLKMSVIVTALVIGSSLARAQTTKVSADEAAGNSAMAERFAQMAQMNLASQTIVPATLRQSAVLLEEACRLSPAEPRFPRLLAEAYIQLSNQLEKQGQSVDEARSGAVAALDRYLKIPKTAGDQQAQIQIIDLQSGKLDSGDARRNYFKQLIGTDQLAAEVRAHAAILMAQLCNERSEGESARQYIDQALKLFPLSPEALRMQYSMLDPKAPPAERTAVLMKMLRSNPSQPGAMTDLASILASVGLVDPALQWYQQSFSLSQRMGVPPNLNVLTTFAAELVIADQLTVAQTFVQQLLEQDPSNSDASFLALLIAKRGGDADKVAAATEAARNALKIRLGKVSDVLNGREPTSQPAAGEQPAAAAVPQVDIGADLKLLAERGSPTGTALYGSTLADMAWLEIYYNGKPADAQPYIDGLRQILAPDAIILARLEGWGLLVDGKKDEAKVKLSAIADLDPFARLGMIQLETTDVGNDQTVQAARKLLSENASGVVGAMLIEALRPKVGLMPATADAAAVRAELDKLPKDWLDILDLKTVTKFYSLKAEPLAVAINFGEPILAKVTLANTSAYDITVGPNGTIRSDIWIDCQVRGLAPTYVTGAAFDRLGRRMVLHPREEIQQIVRVDQGALAQNLQGRPNLGFPLYFNLFTNPVTMATGISPGPAGQRQQFTKVIERSPAPLDQKTLQAAFEKLRAGQGDVRIRTLELLGTMAKMLQTVEDPQAKAKSTEITDVVRARTDDPVPSVRAQATFLTALLADATVREGILRQMLADEVPVVRMSGLAAIQGMIEPAKRKEWAQPLADSDKDEVVRRFAASVVECADLPPPTTQPAEEGGEVTAGAGK